MNVSQQIILNLVRDNTQIPVYERAGIFNYKHFTTDYNYLQFVLTRYAQTGSVTAGELYIRFPEFPTDDIAVSTDSEFLIYQIKELYVYNELSAAINDGQNRFPNDGIQLLGFLEDKITDLRAALPIRSDYDLIEHVRDRYDNYNTTANTPNSFITTGFSEVDSVIGGWSKNGSGELGVFVGRMGMGKTWLMIYSCVSAWKAGFIPGFISIEMGRNDIGYRVDTALSGLSNSALRRGDALDMNEYQRYLNMMEGKSGIKLRSKKDFGGHITPSAIESWIKQAHLDIVFIDGIGYIENERINAGYKSDAASITDVSEDLMAVSSNAGTPIIVTAQANRDGSDRSSNPQLEHVRGSDGLGINASFVASIAFPDDSHKILTLEIIKCRYGEFGGKFNYDWDPNFGYIQSRGEVTTGGAFFGNS